MEWSPDGIIAYVQLSCESEADCGVHSGKIALMTAFGSIVGRISRESLLCRRLRLSFCW